MVVAVIPCQPPSVLAVSRNAGKSATVPVDEQHPIIEQPSPGVEGIRGDLRVPSGFSRFPLSKSVPGHGWIPGCAATKRMRVHPLTFQHIRV
jgi:hypothetical protein